YKHSLRWLPNETPNQEDLKNLILRMREKGLKPTGVNSVARAINAYLRWSGSSLKIQKLKEPQEIFPTFTAAHVSSIVRWKPKGFYKIRLQLLALILLDTGCRISEALNLRVRDFDMDNLLVLLDGKGRKQRLVPFSFELRKRL